MHWHTAARRCGMVPGCRLCWGDCNWELTLLHTMGVALSSRCAFESDLTVIWLVESDLWEIITVRFPKISFLKNHLFGHIQIACMLVCTCKCVRNHSSGRACVRLFIVVWRDAAGVAAQKRRQIKSYEKNGSKRKMRPFVSCEVHNQLWPHPDSCWLKRSIKHCLHFQPSKE